MIPFSTAYTIRMAIFGNVSLFFALLSLSCLFIMNVNCSHCKNHSGLSNEFSENSLKIRIKKIIPTTKNNRKKTKNNTILFKILANSIIAFPLFLFTSELTNQPTIITNENRKIAYSRWMHSLHEYFSQIDTRFGSSGCIISVVFTFWQCLCWNLISEKNIDSFMQKTTRCIDISITIQSHLIGSIWM